MSVAVRLGASFVLGHPTVYRAALLDCPKDYELLWGINLIPTTEEETATLEARFHFLWGYLGDLRDCRKDLLPRRWLTLVKMHLLF